MKDDTEKVEVRKKLNPEEISEQFYDYLKTWGIFPLLSLFLLAIAPPVLGVFLLLFGLGMKFLDTRSEEQLEAFTVEVEVEEEEEAFE